MDRLSVEVGSRGPRWIHRAAVALSAFALPFVLTAAVLVLQGARPDLGLPPPPSLVHDVPCGVSDPSAECLALLPEDLQQLPSVFEYTYWRARQGVREGHRPPPVPVVDDPIAHLEWEAKHFEPRPRHQPLEWWFFAPEISRWANIESLREESRRREVLEPLWASAQAQHEAALDRWSKRVEARGPWSPYLPDWFWLLTAGSLGLAVVLWLALFAMRRRQGLVLTAHVLTVRGRVIPLHDIVELELDAPPSNCRIRLRDQRWVRLGDADASPRGWAQFCQELVRAVDRAGQSEARLEDELALAGLSSRGGHVVAARREEG